MIRVPVMIHHEGTMDSQLDGKRCWRGKGP